MPSWEIALSWVDMSMVAVLVLSVVIGLFRGLVFEVLSLAGWVVAYFVAQAYSGVVAAYLPRLGHSAAAFVITFFVVLVIWSLLARTVRMFIQATPLSAIDRILGGAFGALRGVLLLLVVTTIVLVTPAHASPIWRQSHGAQILGEWVRGIRLQIDFGDRAPTLPSAPSPSAPSAPAATSELQRV